MITFFCATMSCLNMYLGSGYVLTQTTNTIVYYNFQKKYICNKQDSRFECLPTDKFMAGTSMDSLPGNH